MSLIILITTISTASATNYAQVGVRVGDTADYTSSYPTANGTLTTERFHIEILQIAGTNVTIEFRWVLLNNSEGPAIILNGDLAGYYPIPEYGVPDIILVAANLGVGDNLYQVPNTLLAWWRIDKTTTMFVAGWYRRVNHAEYTGPLSLPVLRGNFTYSNEAYYDETTGLLVETNITVTGALSPYPNGTKASYITTLTTTTAFSALPPLNPESKAIALPVTTAAIAVVALTMIAAATTQHRKRKTTTN
jgi:hypothetical protein